MKLIVGLGNFGHEYEHTRHNIGFMVLNALAQDFEIKFETQPNVFKDALIARSASAGVTLLKPHTMMNLSGHAVKAVADYYKIEQTDIWVVHDDFDLQFGKLRIRMGGGTAGHNGVKSIVSQLGEDFGRIRVGIGNASLKDPIPSDVFVLSGFNAPEQTLLPKILRETADIIINHLSREQLEDTSYNL